MYITIFRIGKSRVYEYVRVVIGTRQIWVKSSR